MSHAASAHSIVDSIAEWTHSENYFSCDFQCYEVLRACILNQTQMLNGLLIVLVIFILILVVILLLVLLFLMIIITYFLCNFACCYMLQAFILKCTELLYGLWLLWLFDRVVCHVMFYCIRRCKVFILINQKYWTGS